MLSPNASLPGGGGQASLRREWCAWWPGWQRRQVRSRAGTPTNPQGLELVVATVARGCQHVTPPLRHVLAEPGCDHVLPHRIDPTTTAPPPPQPRTRCLAFTHPPDSVLRALSHRAHGVLRSPHEPEHPRIIAGADSDRPFEPVPPAGHVSVARVRRIAAPSTAAVPGNSPLGGRTARRLLGYQPVDLAARVRHACCLAICNEVPVLDCQVPSLE